MPGNRAVIVGHNGIRKEQDMNTHVTLQAAFHTEELAGGFALRAWIRANAVGLGAAYSFLALFGGSSRRWEPTMRAWSATWPC